MSFWRYSNNKDRQLEASTQEAGELQCLSKNHLDIIQVSAVNHNVGMIRFPVILVIEQIQSTAERNTCNATNTRVDKAQEQNSPKKKFYRKLTAFS